jgi:hypothetical protein
MNECSQPIYTLLQEKRLPESNFLHSQPFNFASVPQAEPELKKAMTKRRRQQGAIEEVFSNPRDSKVQKMANNNSPVLPSREEILEMSSKEFESRIEQLEHSHVFSNRELQDVKVYKRLIKNRESAQASRQKKKQVVRELEQRVIELEEENFKLRRSVTVTAAENIALKNELQLFKSRTNPSLNPTQINNNGQVIPPFVPRITQNPHALRGMMMMVVLLSFGLLVGNVGFPMFNKNALPYVLAYSFVFFASSSSFLFADF